MRFQRSLTAGFPSPHLRIKMPKIDEGSRNYKKLKSVAMNVAIKIQPIVIPKLQLLRVEIHLLRAAHLNSDSTWRQPSRGQPVPVAFFNIWKNPTAYRSRMVKTWGVKCLNLFLPISKFMCLLSSLLLFIHLCLPF